MEPHRILVIEDDPAIGQSLLDGLKHYGFRAELCIDGSSGMNYAKQHLAHLIILDIRLPDGSGFDFCRQMRQAGLNQPIIMLTAQQDETDKVLGLEMGADDYMTKPFSLRELVSRIRAQLRRAYGEYSLTESNSIVINDLVLDQITGQARRGDEPINLTPTEFRLLNYLARHRGQAVTRSQIVEAVWGYAPDVESEKTVNVHIRRLREKIELKPDQPSLILTVPGIGYRMAK
jgi:two-component system alkaline phosphatase synthesis response regulator PhoP